MSDGKQTALSRDYKVLVSSMGISRFGTSTFNLVILWVILSVTSNNAFLAGLGDGLISLPLFMSFFVGAFIDSSIHKKSLAYIASLLRAIFLVSVLFGIYYNHPLVTLITIYASGFMVGLTSDVLNSIRANWTKQFLAEELYKAGSSFSNSVGYAAEGFGFAASGIFLALGSIHSFDAIILVFIASLVPLFLIHPNEITEKKNTINSAKEGFSFISKTKSLKQIMVIALIANLVFGMSGIVFIALVKIKLGLPPYYVSVIFLLFIVGTIIGSAVAPRFKGKIGKLSFVTFSFLGLSILTIPFLNNILYIILPALVIGTMIGLVNVFLNTAFLKIIPTEMMARVNGAFNTFSLGATFSSGMLAGLIIQLTSVSVSFFVIGFGVLVANPLWLIFRDLYSLTI